MQSHTFTQEKKAKKNTLLLFPDIIRLTTSCFSIDLDSTKELRTLHNSILRQIQVAQEFCRVAMTNPLSE